MIRPLLSVLLLSLPLLASARVERSVDPVYLAGNQYTASLSPASQMWTLAPLDGNDVEIRPASLCPHTTVPAPGLWVVGRDADGRPELIAPSATLLPEGHSGRIALRACDDPVLRDSGAPAYGVPAAVLDLLVAQTGAVLVDD